MDESTLGTIVEIDASTIIRTEECDRCWFDSMTYYPTNTMNDTGVEQGWIGICSRCIEDTE